MIRHIGYERKTTIKVDFLIEAQGDDLYNLPWKYVPGACSLLGGMGQKGHIFWPDTEDDHFPQMGIADGFNLLT